MALKVHPLSTGIFQSHKGTKHTKAHEDSRLLAPGHASMDVVASAGCGKIIRRLRLAITLLVCLAAQTGSAQQVGSIGGRVLDAKTNEPLPGVNVVVQGTTIGAATDEKGLFIIKNVPAGVYTINATMIGFAPGVRAGVSVTADGTTPVVLRLAESLIEVPTTVVTASKRAQSFMETPASVGILNSKQISQQNFVTLDKALEFTPGVNVMGGQLNIRGSSGYSRGAGSRVLLLVDGIPMMPGDSGDIKWDALPTNEIDHVEIVKGAASALYGSSAMGGVINVINKDPGDTPKTTLKVTGGLYSDPHYPQWKWTDRTRNYSQQDLAHERAFGKLKVRAAIGRRQSTGFAQNGQYQRNSLFLKTKYFFSPTSNLMIYGNYADDDHGSIIQWIDLNSPLEVSPENRHDTIFSSKLQTGGMLTTVLSKRVGMKVRGSYYRNHFEDRFVDNRDQATSHNAELESQFDVELGRGHATTVGITVSRNDIRSTIFSKHEIRDFSDYGQHEWKVSEVVTLSGGARFDYHWVDTGLREWQTSPKLGLVYAPKPSLSFRLSTGRGFRSATAAEMFISTTTSGFKVVPNIDLKSERAWSFEVGGQYIFPASRLNVAAFWNDYDDLIEGNLIQLNSGTVIQFVNYNRARIRGIELELQNSFFRQRLTVNSGYTYLDARDLTADAVLAYRPKHLFTVNGTYAFSRFSIGADFRYVSKIQAVRIFPDDPRVEQRVLNLRAGAQFKPITLTLNAYNALQWNYTQVERTLEPIRSFALTGALEF